MESIDKWLKSVLAQPLTALRHVDIGFGYQSFRVQSATEASCFDFIVRDELKCKTFIAQFTGICIIMYSRVSSVLLCPPFFRLSFLC